MGKLEEIKILKMESKKIAVVSGVTGGIGKEVALGLIKQNYELHVLARSKDKFESLKALAKEIDGSASLTFYKVDLSLTKSTKEANTELKKNISSVDLLYQSAGLIPGKVELTTEGIEKTFAVSYLTRYVILKELLPLVLLSQQKLIVTMAGAGQNGKIYFDDVNFQKKKFKPMDVVKQFQQANDALAIYLSEEYRDKRLKVYCLIPGLVDTGIHDGWPLFFRFFIRKILGTFIMVTPKKAAEIPLNLIDGSLSPNGVLINEKGKVINPSKLLMDKNYREKVVELSQSLVRY